MSGPFVEKMGREPWQYSYLPFHVFLTFMIYVRF